MKMTLGQIIASKGAWEKIATSPKPPKMALAISTFVGDIINKNITAAQIQINEYIGTYNTAKEGENPSVSAEVDKEKYAEFLAAYNEYVGAEVEFEPIKFTMVEFIDALDTVKGASIEELVIDVIKPFFKE